MTAIRLPKEIELRLNTLATSTGRTKSYYIREALLTHLSRLETIYLAEKRRQNIRACVAPAMLIKAGAGRRSAK